jgi:hypothetical protein
MASGNRIPRTAVPADWIKPDVLFVGPLLHELPTDCVNWFEPGISCLLPSGWLRRWTPDGAISHADRLPPLRGKKWNVIVVSEEEIRALPEQQLFDLGEIVCVTRGENGSRIWSAGDWIEVPAVESKPVDFTGAGDIWAASFVIALSQGKSPVEAGIYASTASAIAIESIGLSGNPSPDEISARLPAH